MTEERKVVEAMMAESLAEMKALVSQAYQQIDLRSWYDRACEFMASIEARFHVICEDDFSTAMNYFIDVLWPEVKLQLGNN